MIGEEIERLIETTRNIIPGCNIIMNELLPRYHRNLMVRQDYEEKRIECNQIISDICDSHEVHFVRHQNLSQMHFIDGIHLNRKRGIGQYVRNLKEVANPLVGVKTAQTESLNQSTSIGNYRYYGNQRPDYRQNQYRGQTRDQHREDRPGYSRVPSFRQDGPPFRENLRYNGINMKLFRLALQGFS